MITLTISGHELHLLAVTPKSEDAMGECEPMDDGSYTLRVSPKLNDRAFCDTLFHEIIEAVNCIYDTDMTHNQIQTLGVALSQLAPDEFTTSVRAQMAPPVEKPKKAPRKRIKGR